MSHSFTNNKGARKNSSDWAVPQLIVCKKDPFVELATQGLHLRERRIAIGYTLVEAGREILGTGGDTYCRVESGYRAPFVDELLKFLTFYGLSHIPLLLAPLSEMTEFGIIVQNKRKEKSLNQWQLAQLSNVPYRTIILIETTQKKIPDYLSKRLASFLEMELPPQPTVVEEILTPKKTMRELRAIVNQAMRPQPRDR